MLKAKDVHVGVNRKSIMLKLHSSKTHSKADRPQTIIINENDEPRLSVSIYCPILQLNRYWKIRPAYVTEDEQFFVFVDRTPVTQAFFRNFLREIIVALELDPQVYEPHSFRIGRASDLMKKGFSIDRIKQIGRWKSNAVYKYLRE